MRPKLPLKSCTKEGNMPYYFLFACQSNTKNIVAKCHENIPNLSQEINKNTENVFSSFQKNKTKLRIAPNKERQSPSSLLV